MTEIQSLPSYDDVQKIRLMEWVHNAFFEGWKLSMPLESLLYEGLESLRKAEYNHQNADLEPRTLDWLTWEGDMDDFLTHLYYSRIPGCVPFDCSQTINRYIEVSFGEDSLEYLNSRVEKNDLQSFSHYLAACGFGSKRLKRFTLPLELELLAAAALTHPAYPAPEARPEPTPPLPPQKKDGPPQGELF